MDGEIKYRNNLHHYHASLSKLVSKLTKTYFVYVTVSASNHIPQKTFDNFSFYYRSPTAVKIKLETAKQFSHLFQSDSLAPSRIC